MRIPVYAGEAPDETLVDEEGPTEEPVSATPPADATTVQPVKEDPNAV